MARIALICALAIAPLALFGCGGGGGDADEGGGGEGTGGGEEAVDLSAYEGAIASTDLATGEQMYNDVCMACHASSHPLPNIGWGVAQMRRQIREGGDGMPAISADQMSDEQMEAVLAFMVTNGAVVDEGGGDAPADDAGGEEPMEGADGA